MMTENKGFFKCKSCALVCNLYFDICPKCSSDNKMDAIEVTEWLDNKKFFQGKGYGIFIAEGSSFYIPQAEHIEKIDEDNLFSDDEEACKQAEKDGVKLIYNMEGIPDGVYIDTIQNRDILIKALEQHPEYKTLNEKVEEI